MSTMMIDAALLAHAHGVRERAESLRAMAAQLDPVLANTYRRRASELELEAFLFEVQADGALDLDA